MVTAEPGSPPFSAVIAAIFAHVDGPGAGTGARDSGATSSEIAPLWTDAELLASKTFCRPLGRLGCCDMNDHDGSEDVPSSGDCKLLLLS